MPIQRSRDRALGPYAHRRRFRVVFVVGGTRTPETFETESEALARVAAFNKSVGEEDRTIGAAIDRYEEHLAELGNKTKSNKTTITRLRAFFKPFRHDAVDSLTPKKANKIYDAYKRTPTRTGKPPADTTHREVCKQARTFVAWCRDKGWVKGNPFADVKLTGKTKKGKPAVRIDELRKLYAACVEEGSDGAFAVLTALVMGMRATETVSLVARDIDDGGRLIWIDDTKTATGRRALEIPDDVVGGWLRRRAMAAEGGRLWPGKNRSWLYREAKRLSKAAGIPPVGAQQLRFAHSNIAKIAGVTASVVAAQLGHTEAVNAAHYTEAGVDQSAQARRAFGVINGGAR